MRRCVTLYTSNTDWHWLTFTHSSLISLSECRVIDKYTLMYVNIIYKSGRFLWIIVLKLYFSNSFCWLCWLIGWARRSALTFAAAATTNIAAATANAAGGAVLNFVVLCFPLRWRRRERGLLWGADRRDLGVRAGAGAGRQRFGCNYGGLDASTLFAQLFFGRFYFKHLCGTYICGGNL